jgi:TrpR-related protein YerC/YecD
LGPDSEAEPGNLPVMSVEIALSEMIFLNPKLKDKSIDRLFEAILLLETVEECYRFFEDLGTVAEIKAFAQRFEVASMLMEKKTYREIHNKTGASEATISRVNRALFYGADGYKLILERLKEKERQKEKEEKAGDNSESKE